MIYLTTESWFAAEYNPDDIEFNNTTTGFFLIAKQSPQNRIYLCDFAIVTKRRVKYFPIFTRLYLSELKNSDPVFEFEFDVDYPKLIKIDSKWKKEFNYFSQVISDESYYKISQEYSRKYAKKVFLAICDLGVLEQQGIKDIGFNEAKNYLLTHNRSRYAYHKGIELLFSKNVKEYLKKTTIDALKIKLTENEERSISLSFKDKVLGRIPINIFIGKNGSGKSYAIEKLIKGYIRGEYEELSDSINKIVVVSNTISDKYPSTKKTFSKYNIYDLSNFDYDYFSTIRKVKYNATEGAHSVNLKSLVEELLIREVNNELPFNVLDILDITIKNNVGCSFVGLDSTMTSFHSLSELSKSAKNYYLDNGGENLKLDYIFLVKDGLSANLSSGQENFIFIISSLLSTIHNNSLIFIDELENFLHPNFISQAMKILKDCLLKTNSVCIIATHSLHIAREIPKEGVTIFERIGNEDFFTTYKPEIESYSCNLQVMSNYIFNTREEDSLFDETLRELAIKYKSKKELINDLHDKVSREIILSLADRIDEN